MKNVILIIVIFFACSCTKSSSSSNDKNNLITMETSSGKKFSTSNITRVLQTTSGVFYFNADPFSTYRKFYFFTGNFDVNNSLTLEINLNGSNLISSTNSNSSVTINNKDYDDVKLVVNLTSNNYPGLIAGNYSVYDNLSPTILICKGTFNYDSK
jgi:hypothetical protein